MSYNLENLESFNNLSMKNSMKNNDNKKMC